MSARDKDTIGHLSHLSSEGFPETLLATIPAIDNEPTLIKDISGAGALHPVFEAPAVSMSV